MRFRVDCGFSVVSVGELYNQISEAIRRKGVRVVLKIPEDLIWSFPLPPGIPIMAAAPTNESDPIYERVGFEGKEWRLPILFQKGASQSAKANSFGLRESYLYHTVECELIKVHNSIGNSVLWGLGVDAAANGMVHNPGEVPQAHHFASTVPWKNYDGALGFHFVFYFPDPSKEEEVDFGQISISSQMGEIAKEKMPFHEYLNAVYSDEILRQRTYASKDMHLYGGAIMLGNTVYLRVHGDPSKIDLADVTVNTDIFGGVKFSVNLVD